jgi:hypothetical protein
MARALFLVSERSNIRMDLMIGTFRKIVLKDLDKLYEVFVNNSCPLSIE